MHIAAVWLYRFDGGVNDAAARSTHRSANFSFSVLQLGPRLVRMR
ncbi:MAG TPA: hypothetical protein VGJ20_41870 [Xanthobacteraceae bacterium]|jgi:hypothetical protein